MKKAFLILLCLFFIGIDVALAQERTPVFSSSLAGGVGYTYRGVRRNMYRPAMGYNINGGSVTGTYSILTGSPNASSIRQKKYIFRYKDKQIELLENQMEKFMPFIKRLRENKTKSLEMFCIAKDRDIASRRCSNLIGILNSYKPDFKPTYKIISGPAVVKSNNNTVEIIESW